MVKLLQTSLILLILPFGFFGQSDIKLNSTDSLFVNIHFEKDPENSNYYQLNCETNSRDLFGTINFYDKKKKVLLQLLEIEIAHVPGYHTIDTSLFPKGDITIELFVDDKPFKKTVRL